MTKSYFRHLDQAGVGAMLAPELKCIHQRWVRRRLSLSARTVPTEIRRLSANGVTNPGEYIMRIVRLACTLILLAAVLFCRVDGAAAQGSDAVRQACTPDAMRLCSDVIPDVPKVTACMKAKSSQVSEACRLAMRGEGRTTRARHHRGHSEH